MVESLWVALCWAAEEKADLASASSMGGDRIAHEREKEGCVVEALAGRRVVMMNQKGGGGLYAAQNVISPQ